jgi:hypothetical protein
MLKNATVGQLKLIVSRKALRHFADYFGNLGKTTIFNRRK